MNFNNSIINNTMNQPEHSYRISNAYYLVDDVQIKNTLAQNYCFYLTEFHPVVSGHKYIEMTNNNDILEPMNGYLANEINSGAITVYSYSPTQPLILSLEEYENAFNIWMTSVLPAYNNTTGGTINHLPIAELYERYKIVQNTMKVSGVVYLYKTSYAKEDFFTTSLKPDDNTRVTLSYFPELFGIPVEYTTFLYSFLRFFPEHDNSCASMLNLYQIYLSFNDKDITDVKSYNAFDMLDIKGMMDLYAPVMAPITEELIAKWKKYMLYPSEAKSYLQMNLDLNIPIVKYAHMLAYHPLNIQKVLTTIRSRLSLNPDRIEDAIIITPVQHLESGKTYADKQFISGLANLALY